MADNKYKLQFTLSNGETINAGEIVAPQGPKGDKGDSADIPYSSSTPFMDGVGSGGSANTVARGDHRHPSDTSRQEKLVSGTNIKTINGQSVLGSGDILISGGGDVSLPIVFSGVSPGPGSGGTIIRGVYTSGFPAAAMIHLESPTYKTLLSPVQIAMFGESAGHTYKLELAPTGIGYTYDGTAYSILRQDNVKTLFGNQQSIYGSGNIDLYKHNLIISQGSTESDRMCVYCQILSSNNLNISSLADFQTIVKDNEFIPATGKLKLWNGDEGSIIGGVCKSGAIEYNIRGKYTNNIDFSSGWATINAAVSGGLTFTDTVTTA